MINIKTNIAQFINKEISSLKKNVDFAKVLANTRTATITKNSLVNEMKKVFDNPTPYTLRSLKQVNATKSKPQASIEIPDWFGKGTAPIRVLEQHIMGGNRSLKNFEKRLIEAGIMDSNSNAVPGSGAKLNTYGNITAGQYTKMLSVLQAHTEVGFNANTTANSRKRNKNLPNLFVVRTKTGKLIPGIWQRNKGGVKPLIIFVNKVNYKKIYRFFEVAEKTTLNNYDEQYKKALFELISK